MDEEQVKKLVLAPFSEDWHVSQLTDRTWNLVGFLESAKHWHVVIERTPTERNDYDTVRGFQVIWWYNRIAILPHRSINFDALKQVFYGWVIPERKALLDIIAAVVQTNGVANCYDRYCHDDEWTYCIFCEEGDFDPHAKPGWKHKPDCLLVRARALLDKEYEEARDQELHLT